MLAGLTRALRDSISFALSTDVKDEELIFQNPPRGMGDTAFCCNSLAKDLGRRPDEVAKDIAQALVWRTPVAHAQATGPYVNMFIDPHELFREAIETAKVPSVATVSPRRIMVEYLSPNTNKPLHLGHIRNGVLGSAVANLLEAIGHTVIRANLVNDRGIHICKSMLAYQLFGNGETPEIAQKKGDHFVGHWYVRFAEERARENIEKDSDSPLHQQAEAMLRKWEEGDPQTLSLWNHMNRWVYDGFSTTYARYGFRFETEYHESDLYLLGKDIVHEGLRKGVFTKLPDGAIVFPLPVETYGLAPNGKEKKGGLLRADGTSIYLTQDLGTAVRKATDYSIDRSVYVVACEQNHHFRVLFDVLKALDYPWAHHLFHLSYEMVELPEGKMKFVS